MYKNIYLKVCMSMNLRHHVRAVFTTPSYDYFSLKSTLLKPWVSEISIKGFVTSNLSPISCDSTRCYWCRCVLDKRQDKISHFPIAPHCTNKTLTAGKSRNSLGTSAKIQLFGMTFIEGACFKVLQVLKTIHNITKMHTLMHSWVEVCLSFHVRSRMSFDLALFGASKLQTTTSRPGCWNTSHSRLNSLFAKALVFVAS